MYPMKPVRTTETFFSVQNLKEWSLERKLDGHRAITIWKNSGPEVYTREKNRIEMPDYIKQELKGLKVPVGTVVDGEIWSFEKRGDWKNRKNVSLSIWDVIAANWRWVGKSPIEARRMMLNSLIPNTMEHIQIEKSFEVSKSIYASLKEEGYKNKTGGIHGVVLKRNGSVRYDHPNRSTESAEWMKIVWRL